MLKKRKFMIIVLVSALLMAGCERGNEAAGRDHAVQSGKKELYRESEAIAENYREIYEQAVKTGTLGTLENIEEIVSYLGNLGYTAVDKENQVDMVNAKRVEEFNRKAKEKKTAELMVISVMEDGGFIRYDLKTEGGKISVTQSLLSWNEGHPESDYSKEYPAYTWDYSDSGYLFFEQYRPAGYDGPSGHTAIRVQPLDRKCRELNRKYILPVSYHLNNMFITDWNEEEFRDLDFYDLFQPMYEMKYGKEFPYRYTYTGDFYEIPENEFEDIFMTYFQTDSSVLRQRTTYFAENHTYQYRPRGRYDFGTTANIPYPEVTDYEENEDGTLKLTVCAVWPQKNTAKALLSEVVIWPLSEERFQYVSNQIIPTEGQMEPAWYERRLTKEEWEQLAP